jgi:hypothetical protein
MAVRLGMTGKGMSGHQAGRDARAPGVGAGGSKASKGPRPSC